MAVVVTLEWPEMTKQLYEKLLEVVDWDLRIAPGVLFHVAWWDGDTMSIVDLWETEADWQRFLDERLAPNFAAAGITRGPDAEVHEVHRYLNSEAVARGLGRTFY
jgi:hypothetical protein